MVFLVREGGLTVILPLISAFTGANAVALSRSENKSKYLVFR